MNTRSLLALAVAAGIAQAAQAAPGTPNIAWLEATQQSGANIAVHWDMWWGENGDRWTLYSNGAIQCEGSLTVNGQNAQLG